jgi:hypothetical protein
MVRRAGLHCIATAYFWRSIRAPEHLEPALKIRSNVFRAAAELPERGGKVLLAMANSGEASNPVFSAIVERLLQ